MPPNSRRAMHSTAISDLNHDEWVNRFARDAKQPSITRI
jgi:hypothetical protein